MQYINEPLNPATQLFQIPDSWTWCRMSDLVMLLSGQDLSSTEYNDRHLGIPYITGASNIVNGEVVINRWTEKPKVIATKNDLLFTCKGTIGEMAFLNVETAHIARQIMAIRQLSTKVSLSYIQIFLRTRLPKVISQAKSMIPGISRDSILYEAVPLPPYNEQKRIVCRTQQLENLLNELFKCLN